MDGQPMCSCLNVKYDPEPVRDGMRERWACTRCGSMFVRDVPPTPSAVTNQLSDEQLAEIRADVAADPDQWDTVPSHELLSLLDEVQEARAFAAGLSSEECARMAQEVIAADRAEKAEVAALRKRIAELEALATKRYDEIRVLQTTCTSLGITAAHDNEKARKRIENREAQLAEMRARMEKYIDWSVTPSKDAIYSLLDEFDIPKPESAS